MEYPLGFTSRQTSANWGYQPTEGAVITDWRYEGGDIAFMGESPNDAGKPQVVSVKIDGNFYQKEGRYQCLDTNDTTRVKVAGDMMTGQLRINKQRNNGTMRSWIRWKCHRYFDGGVQR